ncbi:MAG: hypothetical protein HYU36_09895 [Planctomycetes bacterium]|nr:hypothetical protein [Planctomycetota bacterium]
MGRIRGFIQVDGRQCWALFDSGARNSYVTRDVARILLSWKLPFSQTAVLGGQAHLVSEMCALVGQIEDHWVQTNARVLDEIGTDESGKPIEILFGALAMQEWGIRLDLQNERLDLTHYPREFLEF